MIGLRKNNPAFVYGVYTDLDPTNPFLFAYTRTLGADQFLIALNFSTNTLPYVLPNGIKTGRLLLSNLAGKKEEDASTISLEPWEARVYRL